MSSRHIEKGLISKILERLHQVDEKHFDFGEDEICKEFNCGKKLTAREKLFGDKCVSCSSKKDVDVMMIIQVD